MLGAMELVNHSIDMVRDLTDNSVFGYRGTDIWANSESWCRGRVDINTCHLRGLECRSRWPACRPRQTVRDKRASHNQRNVLKDSFERVRSDVLEPTQFTAGGHKRLQTKIAGVPCQTLIVYGMY